MVGHSTQPVQDAVQTPCLLRKRQGVCSICSIEPSGAPRPVRPISAPRRRFRKQLRILSENDFADQTYLQILPKQRIPGQNSRHADLLWGMGGLTDYPPGARPPCGSRRACPLQEVSPSSILRASKPHPWSQRAFCRSPRAVCLHFPLLCSLAVAVKERESTSGTCNPRAGRSPDKTELSVMYSQTNPSAVPQIPSLPVVDRVRQRGPESGRRMSPFLSG